MRIVIDFDKQPKPIAAIVLETFLDYHLKPNFYGECFDSIFIDFIENPKPKYKYKRKMLYGHIVQISVPQTFVYEENASVRGFKSLFQIVFESFQYLNEIKIKNNDFKKEHFLNDYLNLNKILPVNEKELNHWKSHNKIYRELEKNIYLKRKTDSLFDKRQQAKKIPLREIILTFEEFSHYPTNEELEARRINKRRKKAIPIFIQSVFLMYFLRKEMRKLKFIGQYHTIAIVLSDRYEIQKGTEGLSILIPFDEKKYKAVYPTFEIDMPVKSLISNENEQAVNKLLSGYLIKAFKYVKKENIFLPVDKMINIVENLREKEYKVEWFHRRRVFKELGVGARLFCKLSNNSFKLEFILVKGKTEIFRKEIYTSQPWHEAWRSKYDDIIFKENKLVVTHLYNANPIFEMDIKDITT